MKRVVWEFDPPKSLDENLKIKRTIPKLQVHCFIYTLQAFSLKFHYWSRSFLGFHFEFLSPIRDYSLSLY